MTRAGCPICALFTLIAHSGVLIGCGGGVSSIQSPPADFGIRSKWFHWNSHSRHFGAPLRSRLFTCVPFRCPCRNHGGSKIYHSCLRADRRFLSSVHCHEWPALKERYAIPQRHPRTHYSHLSEWPDA